MTPSPIRRVRNTAVALALTAAATGAALATAGPAHAVTGNDCQTTTSITVNGSAADQAVPYATTVTVAASVAVGTCISEGGPSQVTAGTLRIERSADNGVTWSTVTSVDVSTGVTTAAKAGVSGWSFLPQPTEFRVRYTGGTDATSGDTFHDAPVNPTTSYIWAAPVRVAKLLSKHCTTTGCTDTWRINPATSISGLRVQIQRRVNGSWSTIAGRVVSSTGTFTYTFKPGASRVYIPAARGFVASFITVVVARR